LLAAAPLLLLLLPPTPGCSQDAWSSRPCEGARPGCLLSDGGCCLWCCWC